MLKRFFQGLRARGRCPDFLILGVQKGGTTTLYEILAMLPGFSPSKNKELGFFIKDLLYRRGAEWYSSQFINNHGLRFEATPAYIYYPEAPERIYKYNPKCKFIVVMREPASRCYSAYAMYKRFNRDPQMAQNIFKNFTQYANEGIRNSISNLLFNPEFPNFRKLVEEDLARFKQNADELEPSFVRRGLYAKQIKNFMNHFRFDQFLILEQSELIEISSLCIKISSFLGVNINSDELPNPFASNVGESQVISDDDLVVIRELKSFYAPFNEDLFDLIGQRYGWE